MLTAGTNVVGALEWVTAAQANVTFYDADSDPLVKVEFTDLTSTAGSGRFWYNGSYIAANQAVTIDASDLGNLWFQGGSITGTDRIQVRVYDGYGWSNASTLTVSTALPNHAPVVSAANQSVGMGATVLASSMFSVSDADGDSITNYRFWDGGLGGGHFTYNGTTVAGQTDLDVTAANLGNVRYQGGASGGSETLWVTAYDGQTWSAWQNWTQTTQLVFINGGSAVSFAENGTGTVFTATSSLGAEMVYSLGGTDAALFNIDATTSAVTFKAAPNYEAPADAGSNNVYDITVTATDNGSGITALKSVAITVTNVNEAPVITSGSTASFAENGTGTVYTATATDVDAGTTLAYSVGGTDAALFNINATTGAVTFKTAPNYEAPADAGANNVYDITVTATDNGSGSLSATKAVAITVTNVFEGHYFNSASPASFAENGTGTVYTVASTDVDAGTTLTYSLGGTDAAKFAINSGTGVVTFVTAPNYEAPTDSGANNVYNIDVMAFDNGSGIGALKSVAITVTNVNEAPVITSGSTASYAENGTGTVYTSAATDVDAGTTLAYSVGGTDAALFNINATTGAVTFKTAPNYEAPADAGANNVYDITVTASDGILTTAAQAVAITVTNVNAPTVSSVAISSATGITSSILNAGDVVSVTVTMSEATTVVTSGGTPTLILDIGGTTVHAAYASGSGSTALVFTYTVLSGQNDRNGISIAADSLALNGGTLKDAAGLAATLTHSAVADNTGYQVDTIAPDCIITSGAYTSSTDTLVIVGDNFHNLYSAVEGAGTDIKARLDWAKLSWDINGDNTTTANVSFVVGDISSAKATDSSHLTIVLTSAKGISLEATSGFGVPTNDTLDITAGFAKDTAGNAATTDGKLDAGLTIAGQPTVDLGNYGTLIRPVQVEGAWYYYWDSGATTHDVLNALFSSTEAEALVGVVHDYTSNTYRYANLNGVLVALPTEGSGVTITGDRNGTLYNDAGSVTNNTSSSSYNQLLAVWDAYNGTGTGTGVGGVPYGWQDGTYWTATGGDSGHWTVSLRTGRVELRSDSVMAYVALQVLQAPVMTSASIASFAENGTGTVYTATATDVDAGTTLVYTLAGTDGALFNINPSTGSVTFKVAPNYEAPTDSGANNIYDITVTASDGSLTATKAVVITVTNVNEAPVMTSASTASFAENGTGTVYTATATDVDSGTTLAYSVGGTDAALFNINATTGAVTFKTAPNYEVPTDSGANNVYYITVAASDGVNISASQAITITVTNVGEAGESVIDLGSYGKLIAPVQVDGGKWYYYWDRSGDGSNANTGSLNGGLDHTTHDVLDAIFNQDINGVVGGGGNTTDTYRYATINGVHLALPTAGGVTSLSNYQPATAVGSSPAATGSNEVNATYNDLLAIWDAYNGTQAGVINNGVLGVPHEWKADNYWSATQLETWHVVVGDTGMVWGLADENVNYVALQVL